MDTQAKTRTRKLLPDPGGASSLRLAQLRALRRHPASVSPSRNGAQMLTSECSGGPPGVLSVNGLGAREVLKSLYLFLLHSPHGIFTVTCSHALPGQLSQGPLRPGAPFRTKPFPRNAFITSSRPTAEVRPRSVTTTYRQTHQTLPGVTGSRGHGVTCPWDLQPCASTKAIRAPQ